MCVAVCCSMLQYVALCRREMGVIFFMGVVFFRRKLVRTCNIDTHTHTHTHNSFVRVPRLILVHVHIDVHICIHVCIHTRHTLFAECRQFYMPLLQKRPMILRSLLIVATPYVYTCVYTHAVYPVCICTCVAVCCGMLRCVAECCRVLQSVAL